MGAGTRNREAKDQRRRDSATKKTWNDRHKHIFNVPIHLSGDIRDILAKTGMSQANIDYFDAACSPDIADVIISKIDKTCGFSSRSLLLF